MKLLLVERQRVYRDSLRLALKAMGGFDVVGVADGAREAMTLLESCRPDALVCDFLLQDTDAASLVRELRRRGVEVPTMVLAQHGHPLFVRWAVRSGVAGYMLKREPLENIPAALNQVAEGRFHLSAELADAVGDANAARTFDKLSPRELEVFCLLVEGVSNKDVAGLLHLSPKTVDTHRLNMSRKLEIRSPADLVRLAATHGFFVA